MKSGVPLDGITSIKAFMDAGTVILCPAEKTAPSGVR